MIWSESYAVCSAEDRRRILGTQGILSLLSIIFYITIIRQINPENILAERDQLYMVYMALAGIPIVGPALGTIAAGLAIGAGLANVKKIASTEYAYGGATGNGNTIDIGRIRVRHFQYLLKTAHRRTILCGSVVKFDARQSFLFNGCKNNTTINDSTATIVVVVYPQNSHK